MAGDAVQGREPARILVTDDDPAVRRIVKRYLERRGARVSEAAEARTALEILEESPQELLITDIEMPGWSGLWLKAEVERRWPEVPVLVMTGAVGEGRTLEELGVLPERLLLKPFQLDELGRAVERLLAWRPEPGAGESRGRAGSAEDLLEVPYRALVEHIPAVTYIAALDGGRAPIYVSPQIHDLTGFTAAEWLSDPELSTARLHPEDRTRVLEARARLARTGETFRSEYRIVTRTGQVIWVEDEARIVETGPALRFVHGIVLNITERKLAEERLKNLALVDELTGLYNRRGFVTLAGQQLSMARRKSRPLILLLADLDGMKRINDALGHQEGDRALRQAADVLAGTFRKSDVIARIGGDEFAVLATETEGARNGVLTRRLADALQQHNARVVEPSSLSLSVGSAHFDPTVPASLEDLLAKADRSMYEQKWEKRRRN